MPVVIIKDLQSKREEKGKPYRFGVCYDTSVYAKKTLSTVLSMMKPTDKLVTLTVRDKAIDEAAAKSEIAQIASEYGHTAEVLMFDRAEDQSVYERIEHYIIDESSADNYIDFVGVGNRGIGKKDQDKAHLGSMAKVMINNKHVNVIFVPCE